MTPVTDVKIGFGRALRFWRKQTGLSQEKLAELADLHRTYVAGVESGARNPSLVSVNKLAQALGISLETFFSAAPLGSLPQALPRMPLDACPDILLVGPRVRFARSILRTFRRVNLLNRVIVVRDSQDATVYTFHSGRYSGHATWREPGLILLDFTSADRDAASLIDQLKDRKLTPRIPVVVLVSSPSELKAARKRNLGGQGWLVGPFDFTRIQRGLADLGFYLALVR